MTPRLIGAVTLILTLAADQANKLWLIFVYGIEARQPIRLAPFFDVIYAKNPGISYSLFPAETELQKFILILLTGASTAFLGMWLWQARTKLAASGLGLIVGGALGNGYDRLAYGSVADFYYFHLGSFSWYVFNLADVAIVAGVAVLICESFLSAGDRRPAEDAPEP